MLFSDTRIYGKSLELVELVKIVIEELPPGYAFFADQLRRAAASAVLNFAEGCGKSTPRDRKRFFGIARGSVYEVAAALDVGRTLGATAGVHRERGHDLADHIAAMLSRYR